MNSNEKNDFTPDPTLANSEYGCTLVIGRSGSGKSYYVKNILQNIKKSSIEKKNKIYTINVNSREYLDIFKQKITPIDLTKIKEIKKHSYVIVEDIITMNSKENNLLRSLINYYCHHCFLKVFIITHSIYKNGVFSLLSFFHYIVFTGTKSNFPILRFTLNYYKLEKQDLQIMLDNFKKLSINEDHIYFIFDTKKLLFFSYLDGSFKNITINLQQSSNSNAPNLKELQDRYEKFVDDDVENKVKATAIFSIIINCLPLHLIRLHDLTFSFASKKNRSKKIRVSLVDYISCILSDSYTPPTELLCLHKYLKESCCIPQLFINNKQLK